MLLHQRGLTFIFIPKEESSRTGGGLLGGFRAGAVPGGLAAPVLAMEPSLGFRVNTSLPSLGFIVNAVLQGPAVFLLRLLFHVFHVGEVYTQSQACEPSRGVV